MSGTIEDQDFGRMAATLAGVISDTKAVQQYAILDTPPEPSFDRIAELAATVLNCSGAAITFLDGERQWFKAEVGLGVRETPIALSFCAHAVGQGDLLVVGDARADACFAENPLVHGAPYVRFYAGMPIRSPEGTAIGALCVIDPVARPQGINEVQRTTLQVLAKQVEAALELRRAIRVRDEQAALQQELSSRLQFLAERDTLTGLPNRSLFQQRLGGAMGEAGDADRTAVMLVDVDHFKQVNDAFGHDAGDALLKEFAARLRQGLRSTDVVARLGGDEFGAILYGIDVDTTLGRVCRSLEERLKEPILHRGKLIECRASVGIAVHPDHAGTAEALLKCADLALGAAKIRRGSIEVYEEHMGAQFHRELTLLAEARRAIDRDEIVPGYQPKVDLQTGEITGFEALVRLRGSGCLREHAEMFATAFENRELARAIGGRMVSRVVEDMRRWSAAGVRFGRIAINSCAADFAPNDFAERLLASLSAHGVDPGLLELEVTEDIFLGRGSHHVARALELLSAHGVRIALDDFGTGYASLSHLKEFPVDVLKIDRGFVTSVGTNADDSAIVRALIGLGKSLGIETVAEGVETLEQASFMRAVGCCTAQGYLYGPACLAEHVPAMLACPLPSRVA